MRIRAVTPRGADATGAKAGREVIGPVSMIRIAVAAAVAALLLVGHAYAQTEGSDDATAVKRSRAQVAQSSRTTVVVTPRRRQLSPDARRHCEAWLEQEYRVSGTVIVPRQRCWWQ
jgi:hypothetical protein